MKNKKGLSGIVTTLIIILLVLVAIGVIWTVVNNLLGKSSGTIEAAQKCLDVDVRAVKVVENTPGNYNVTLNRKPTGEGDVGAKLVFFGDSGNSEPLDFGEMLAPLETSTMPVNAGINATRVEVTPYFVDDSGKDKLCSSVTEFEFQV